MVAWSGQLTFAIVILDASTIAGKSNGLGEGVEAGGQEGHVDGPGFRGEQELTVQMIVSMTEKEASGGYEQ